MGLGTEDKVPDKNTIWDFKERLGEHGMDECFLLFSKELAKAGLVVKGGKTVYSSFVEFSRPRNSRDENKRIKNGETPKKRSVRA